MKKALTLLICLLSVYVTYGQEPAPNCSMREDLRRYIAWYANQILATSAGLDNEK
ncbi:MAG: hypothetical protein IJK96_06195 [Bacteroidales bacterium]|nr:hypothetical protein [Bacteroidales bacterium]